MASLSIQAKQMSDRFFVQPCIPNDIDQVTLDGSEGHHLARVMRAKIGDSVSLFDGSGFEFDGVIKDIKRDRVDLSIESRTEVNRERAERIHLAVALPKGDRQKTVIEKSVELGVHRLIPLKTDRSQQAYSDKSADRWTRYVIEASKQCRRNRLMEIANPIEMGELVKARTEFESCGDFECWISHPRDAEGADTVDSLSNTTSIATPASGGTRDILIAIGPEGGFTSDEFRAAMEQGWRRLDLGPRILRIETAALAAVCQFDSCD